jgi:hypothetical protein
MMRRYSARQRRERAANMGARFLPQRDDDESPAVDVAGALAGTAYQAEARWLLSQIEAGTALADDDMAKLAAVIEQHPAVLPEDDQHWTSTGESEITHFQGIPTGG